MARHFLKQFSNQLVHQTSILKTYKQLCDATRLINRDYCNINLMCGWTIKVTLEGHQKQEKSRKINVVSAEASYWEREMAMSDAGLQLSILIHTERHQKNILYKNQEM